MRKLNFYTFMIWALLLFFCDIYSLYLYAQNTTLPFDFSFFLLNDLSRLGTTLTTPHDHDHYALYLLSFIFLLGNLMHMVAMFY